MKFLKRAWPYGVMALLLLWADRITKLRALAECVERQIINDFVSCRLMFNRGVSWGFFHTQNSSIFMGVSFAVALITVAIAWYAVIRFLQKKCIAGEILVVVGSLSNLIDRIQYGGVVDFIELSYGDYHWPVFNIADAAIVMGIGIMLFLHRKND